MKLLLNIIFLLLLFASYKTSSEVPSSNNTQVQTATHQPVDLLQVNSPSYSSQLIKSYRMMDNVWVDGFSEDISGVNYSKNDTGSMNYFVKELPISVFQDYNTIKLSVYVKAKDLHSSFKPMGLGLECRILYEDGTKQTMLLHIKEGTYEYQIFSNEISVEKQVKQLTVNGYHRGKSATGEVWYKELEVVVRTQFSRHSIAS